MAEQLPLVGEPSAGGLRRRIDSDWTDASDGAALVQEVVGDARGDDDDVPRSGDDAPAPQAKADRAPDELEALLLEGVDVQAARSGWGRSGASSDRRPTPPSATGILAAQRRYGALSPPTWAVSAGRWPSRSGC